MRWTIRVLAAMAAISAAAPAYADAAADFYKGRTVTIVVAAGPGGNHTKYSQYLAPYLQKHLPGNPKFITQNMGGAGGTKAANYLFNSAPQDGTAIGILLSDTPFASRLRATGVKYDPTKFQYLGGADRTRSAIILWKKTGVRSIADAKKKQVILGSTGKGSQTYTVPAIVNALLGTKFKPITGYRGMGGIYLAMERDEVSGFQSVWSSVPSLRPQWVEKDLLSVIAANSLDKIPGMPNVPLLKDMAGNATDKKVLELVGGNGVLGRAWLAPPRVPADRIAALRAAFRKALNDPAASANAGKRRMTWEPVPWQDLQRQVGRIAAAEGSVIARMKAALKTKK